MFDNLLVNSHLVSSPSRTEWETDPNFELVPESAAFYPAVAIRFGEPEQWIVMVAVSSDTEKVALVQEYLAKKGPH